jgi:uncharacterized membrane protein YgdD (TMEM256/DUF423 family)
MNPNGRRRLWQGLAGLLGAAGVALAAASAHLAASAQAPNLQLASGFLVFHALALLGVAALSHAGARWLAVAGALLAFGSICFSGGLVLVTIAGQGLAPLVPVGGTALILGWIALAVSAVFDR